MLEITKPETDNESDYAVLPSKQEQFDAALEQAVNEQFGPTRHRIGIVLKNGQIASVVASLPIQWQAWSVEGTAKALSLHHDVAKAHCIESAQQFVG